MRSRFKWWQERLGHALAFAIGAMLVLLPAHLFEKHYEATQGCGDKAELQTQKSWLLGSIEHKSSKQWMYIDECKTTWNLPTDEIRLLSIMVDYRGEGQAIIEAMGSNDGRIYYDVGYRTWRVSSGRMVASCVENLVPCKSLVFSIRTTKGGGLARVWMFIDKGPSADGAICVPVHMGKGEAL